MANSGSRVGTDLGSRHLRAAATPLWARSWGSPLPNQLLALRGKGTLRSKAWGPISLSAGPSGSLPRSHPSPPPPWGGACFSEHHLTLQYPRILLLFGVSQPGALTPLSLIPQAPPILLLSTQLLH